MAKEVQWNKYIYERFCELALLSEFEQDILLTRIKGMSITQQSMKFCVSESKVSKTVRILKDKYDDVQRLDGSNLPPRRGSVQEEWMDNN